MHRSDYFRRFLIIGLSGPIVALNVWILSQAFRYFEHLITVVIIAAILAFLLSYPVRFFERARLNRLQAVGLVLLVSLILLAILGLTLVPILIEQTTQLLQNIPAWLEASRQNLEWLDRLTKDRQLPYNFSNLSNQINTRIENWVELLLSEVPGFAIGTVSRLFDFFLIVVLAFYMLLYGDRLWQGLINLLPTPIGGALSESLQFNFQKFFIGQLLLGLFMVATLTPIFLFLKVGFGLLFALLIGMSELIPFIGATLGIGLVTFLVVLQNFGLAVQVAIAALIMQQIKDNLITPRLMGTFIGLNPIWILVALLAGAQIAGLLGVLLSIPIAGTIKGTIEALRAQHQPQIITTESVSTDQSEYSSQNKEI
jgi:predicted PurR-regulated permease PerM